MRPAAAVAGSVLVAAFAAAGSPSHAAAQPLRVGTAEQAMCAGMRVTILGTNGRDVLRGTPGDDVIAGLAAGDTIDGRGGDDVICGGDGDDRLHGGPGEDRLLGQGDYVGVNGVRGDTLDGGGGDDHLDGGWDPNTDYHRDTVDRISYQSAPSAVTVNLAAGTASGQEGVGRDRIVKEPILGVAGSAFDDTIRGTDTRNLIDTGQGADRVFAAGGADEVDLGPYASNGDDADDVVDLGAGNDAYHQDGGRDRVMGGPGDDRIEAGSIQHDSRSLTAFGGPGDDTFDPELQRSGSVLSGGRGRDSLIFGSFNTDALTSQDARLDLDTGRGTFSAGSDTSGVPASLTGTIGGIERFHLALYNFTGDPNSSRVVFTGSDAEESITMAAASDSLLATMGKGDDRVAGSRYRDLLRGGPGTDTADGRQGRDLCASFQTTVSCEE